MGATIVHMLVIAIIIGAIYLAINTVVTGGSVGEVVVIGVVLPLVGAALVALVGYAIVNLLTEGPGEDAEVYVRDVSAIEFYDGKYTVWVNEGDEDVSLNLPSRSTRIGKSDDGEARLEERKAWDEFSMRWVHSYVLLVPNGTVMEES